ncbi:MAG: hypothetical protein GX973_03805 [Firmicutes bacterium]|nr:hypothetical protein [Bacillota bacterium]
MKIWEQFNRFLSGGAGRPTGGFYRGLLLLILLGSGLLWLGSWFSPPREEALLPPEGGVERERSNPGEGAIVSELTEMIEQIEGVSNVKIFITLESGGRLELVKDKEENSRETREEDGGGGSREIVENNCRETHVILRDHQGGEQPLVLQESTPRYRGVLVVAEGVEHPVVKDRVTEALKSVLNLSYHRITVLPRGD